MCTQCKPESHDEPPDCRSGGPGRHDDETRPLLRLKALVDEMLRLHDVVGRSDAGALAEPEPGDSQPLRLLDRGTPA